MAMSNPHDGLPPVWQRFLTEQAAGGVLGGLVVKVVPFGAFVELDEGVHGLLHESEYASAPDVGSRITVRIKEIDVQRRRMILEPV